MSANFQHTCNQAILVALNILIKLTDLLMQVSYSSQTNTYFTHGIMKSLVPKNYCDAVLVLHPNVTPSFEI